MSSTEGSPTSTCWKRRSSAGSFSIRSRYSSSVVAPTMRSSPRASIGLSMLPASIAPSAAPAPTTVCSSSMNVMTWPSLCLDLVEHGLEPLLELAAVLRARDHAAQVKRDQPLAAQRLGHVAGHDPLGEALDDGGLADAGLADQHRVVLRPPGQHLDHPADLGVTADDRVELAVLGLLGQVDAVLLQRLVGALRVLAGDPGAAAHLGERLCQRVGGGAGLAQQRGRLPAVGRQADEQVLGGDVLVVQLLGAVRRGVDDAEQLTGQLRRGGGGAAHLRQLRDVLGSLLGDERPGRRRPPRAVVPRCRRSGRAARQAGAAGRPGGCRPPRPAAPRRTAPPGSCG